MIHYLLLFQFTFLYCLSVVIGLVVYGSNFDGITGWLYLFPLIVLPVIHKSIYPFIARGLAPKWRSLILAMGAITGLMAYKSMHFAYWDEHSSSQAIAVSLLGVLSYFASVYGATRVRQWQGKHSIAGVAALLIIALTWWYTTVFPMLPLFAVSLILALAILWPLGKTTTALQYQLAGKLPTIIRPGYLLFLLMLDLSLVVWDFQVNSQWATHIACAFLMASVGYYVVSKSITSRIRIWIYGLVFVFLINTIVGIIWPVWLLMLAHAAINGLLLGVLCRYTINSHSGEFQPQGAIAVSLVVVLGMVFGYLFYANLDYVQWRIVFILPYLLFVFFQKRKRSSL